MATGLSMFTACLRDNMDHVECAESLRCESGLTFIDFLPRIINSGKLLESKTYESFRMVVDRANEFLQSDCKWKIVTCESVHFFSKGNKSDSLKMAYIEKRHSYIRGLRLWLTERKGEKERKQQIGYLNLIPELKDEEERLKSEWMSPSKLEALDTVIEKFNSNIQTNPLPGRVITIESEAVMIDDVSSYPDFDPDRSQWRYCEGFKHFVIILRIFYDVMTASAEEIGVKDFVPDMIDGPYESFFKVLKKASTWCAQQQNFRFCNAQTLDINPIFIFLSRNQRMDYMQSSGKRQTYARILRVAYTKPCAISATSSLSGELTYRTFEPVRLTKRRFKLSRGTPFSFESFADTRTRISEWIQKTGARVLSAETTTYLIGPGDELNEGTEANGTEKTCKKNEYRMFVIRLYFDGVYEVAPSEISDEIPEIVSQRKCVIS